MVHPTTKTSPHHSLQSQHPPWREITLSSMALTLFHPQSISRPSRDQEQQRDSTLPDLSDFAFFYTPLPLRVRHSITLQIHPTNKASVRFRSIPSYTMLHSHSKCMLRSSCTRRLQRTDHPPRLQIQIARSRNPRQRSGCLSPSYLLVLHGEAQSKRLSVRMRLTWRRITERNSINRLSAQFEHQMQTPLLGLREVLEDPLLHLHHSRRLRHRSSKVTREMDQQKEGYRQRFQRAKARL